MGGEVEHVDQGDLVILGGPPYNIPVPSPVSEADRDKSHDLMKCHVINHVILTGILLPACNLESSSAS